MLDLAILIIFPGLMAFAAFSDLISMKIQNWIPATLIITFFILALVFSLPITMVAWHLLSAAVVLMIGLVLRSLKMMGGGDVKLAAATAIWLGFGSLLDYWLILSILGAILTVGVVVIRHSSLPTYISRHLKLLSFESTTIGIPYGIVMGITGLIVYPQTVIWKAAISF